MTRTERLEDLLGKDGSPATAAMMDALLPDGEWTQADWDEALENTAMELAEQAQQDEAEWDFEQAAVDEEIRQLEADEARIAEEESYSY